MVNEETMQQEVPHLQAPFLFLRSSLIGSQKGHKKTYSLMGISFICADYFAIMKCLFFHQAPKKLLYWLNAPLHDMP